MWHKTSSITILTACMVMFALLFGGTLHSVIPHTHGSSDHSHEEKTESASWTSLHSALRHEEKQLLQMLLALVWAATLGAAYVAVQSGLIALFPIPVHAANYQRGDYLRRGIARYRKFR